MAKATKGLVSSALIPHLIPQPFLLFYNQEMKLKPLMGALLACKTFLFISLESASAENSDLEKGRACQQVYKSTTCQLNSSKTEAFSKENKAIFQNLLNQGAKSLGATSLNSFFSQKLKLLGFKTSPLFSQALDPKNLNPSQVESPFFNETYLSELTSYPQRLLQNVERQILPRLPEVLPQMLQQDPYLTLQVLADECEKNQLSCQPPLEDLLDLASDSELPQDQSKWQSMLSQSQTRLGQFLSHLQNEFQKSSPDKKKLLAKKILNLTTSLNSLHANLAKFTLRDLYEEFLRSPEMLSILQNHYYPPDTKEEDGKNLEKLKNWMLEKIPHYSGVYQQSRKDIAALGSCTTSLDQASFKLNKYGFESLATEAQSTGVDESGGEFFYRDDTSYFDVNAYYLPQRNSLCLMPAISKYLANDPDTRFFIMAHEMGHSIDPNTSKNLSPLTAEPLYCLEKGAKITDKQKGEALADFMAAEALSLNIKAISSQAEKQKKVIQTLKGFCALLGPADPEDSLHPTPQDRIEKIILRNADLMAAIGCEKFAKNQPLCESLPNKYNEARKTPEISTPAPKVEGQK